MKKLYAVFVIFSNLFFALTIFAQPSFTTNISRQSSACITWDLVSTASVTSTVGNINGQAESIGVGSSAPFMSVFLPYSSGQRLWVGNTGWVAGPLDPMRYVEFNASPLSGNSFTVTNVSFNYGDNPLTTNFNILNFKAYYSIDNWANSTVLNSTALVYLNTAMSLFSQNINVLVPSGKTFSLRIYPYALLNGIAMTPTFAIHNNVVICGTTDPEVLNSGSICGVKFNDLNGNGVKDAGEPGLPNWLIGLGVATVPPVMTDSLGNYCFNNLPAGTYTISETSQSGWQQTFPPSPGTHTITLAAGQSVSNINFGNKLNSTLGCIQPPQGMVAWWPMDETSGSSSSDFAGFNNSGTDINSPTPVPAKVLGGLQFDGLNDYVEVPNHFELNFGTGNFSIDMWIRTSDNTGLYKMLVDKRTQNGFNYQGYSFYLNNGNLSLQLADGGVATDYLSGVFVADGNWHHIGVTVSRSLTNGILFYRDGVGTAVGNPTLRPGSLDNPGPLIIGRQSYTNQFAFKGILDEIELFNRVLTPPEIIALYQAGSAGKCKPTLPTSVDDDKASNTLPKGFQLEQNYPNPFNPSTRIQYSLGTAAYVSLKVYNMFGLEVAILVNGHQEAGSYNVLFNTNKETFTLSSGVYFYRLNAGSFVSTKKLILLK